MLIDNNYVTCYNNKTYNNKNPPVAQLDNATDSDSGEWGFKSLRAGQNEIQCFMHCFYF